MGERQLRRNQPPNLAGKRLAFPSLRHASWRPQSLQWRLTTEMALLLILGLGSVSLWSSWQMQQMLINSHLQNVEYIAQRLPRDFQVYGDMLSSQEGLQRTVDSVAVPGLILWVKNPQGQLLAQSANLRQQPMADHLIQVATMPLKPTIYPVGSSYFILREQKLDLKSTLMGKVYLAQDITAEQQQLQQGLHNLLWVTLGATSVMMLLLALRIKQALRPLAELGQRARAISAEDLGQAPLQLSQAPSEVKGLAQAFNMMLLRLGNTLENQRQFVGNVSHELRTPLTIVVGYLQGVLRRGENLNEYQREALETAHAEADRTVRMLQDLLDLARADSGFLQVRLQPFVLNELVTEVVELVTTLHPHPVLIEATELVTVQADRDRLRQVLVNLVDNAIKYSDAQVPVQLKLLQATDHAVIQVCDQGAGIPLADQTRIFERFYRVDETRTRSTGGHGLGLAIVKTLVEAMGGQIAVRSVLGQGSTFTITLAPAVVTG